MFHNRLVRFENKLTRELPRLFREHTAVIHRREWLESVLSPDLIILSAMSRRGVHQTRALLQRHVGRNHKW